MEEAGICPKSIEIRLLIISIIIRQQQHAKEIDKITFKPPGEVQYSKSDVWLTVHRNSVWIRKTN